VLNTNVLKKIDRVTAKESPPSQKEIARQLQVSRRTVQRGIKILKKTIRRKTKVHQLTDAQKKNRLRTCRNFYRNYLTRNKSEYLVSLDEALFCLQDCNGQRRIYYSTGAEKNPPKWVLPRKENFCRKFMVVGAISGRGVLPLFKCPEKVKINAKFYIDCVLKPLLEIHVPKLYGKKTNQVIVHHDAASSHTAKLTQQYAKDLKARLGITIVQNHEIPVKSPDVAPMDFFGFGYLKRKLFLRRPQTFDGLWNVLKQEWNKVDLATVKRVYKSWNERCRLVLQEKGSHIESVRNLHSKRSPLN
jgi:HTH domain